MPAWSTLVAQEIPSLLEYLEHTRVLWEYHYRYLNLGTTGSPVRLYRYQILILQSTYPDIRVASMQCCCVLVNHIYNFRRSSRSRCTYCCITVVLQCRAHAAAKRWRQTISANLRGGEEMEHLVDVHIQRCHLRHEISSLHF